MSFEEEEGEETFYFNEDFGTESFESNESITEAEISRYSELFDRLDVESKGYLEGSIPRDFLLGSGIPKFRLGLIWRLSDVDSDSKLNRSEFILAMHLVVAALLGYPLPSKWNHPLPLQFQNQNHVIEDNKDQILPPKNHFISSVPQNIKRDSVIQTQQPPPVQFNQTQIPLNRASSSPDISRRPLPSPNANSGKPLSNSPSQQRIPNTTSFEKNAPPPKPPRTLSSSQMLKQSPIASDSYVKPLPVFPPSRQGSVNASLSRPVSVNNNAPPPLPSKPSPGAPPKGGSLGRKSVLPPLPPSPNRNNHTEQAYPIIPQKPSSSTSSYSENSTFIQHSTSSSSYSSHSPPPSSKREVVIEVAPGFFNIRGSFKFKGIINIGTHMSLAKLNNGKYLVIDAAPLSDQIKLELDELTDNGRLMEAVIHTHPFHTLAAPEFFAAYPNVPNYGTPRHLRKMPEINWAGSMNDCRVQAKWRPEIEMRIPAGAEFADPLPEATNHFSSVFVLHKASGTIHVDDTIMVCYNPGFILRAIRYRSLVIFSFRSDLPPA
eukprot:TRINITY_DN4093_c0_g1_i3.p1 TRINITY_DN4093_c0_g1~~TRINITY_DN4093_c0_g1_i3.p1  ORF type:complete len:546 (+),score=167.84 TRINITY_DN4093_c0_g1_i3:184-1821(+)